MDYQIVLTPFCLGKEKPELYCLKKDSWRFNKPVLSSDTTTGMINEIHAAIKKEVTDTLLHNDIPVSVSGDCCAAIPVLAALQEQGVSPIVLWLDAHGDFNTEETTITGFLGGMPLAKITGRGDQQLINAAGMTNMTDADILLVDGRDLDPAEKTLIESSGIYWMKDIQEVKHFDFRGRPLFIHFDTDIINASDAPAMKYPVYGGPRPDELADMFQYIRKTQDICAVSVTAWEPSLDKDERTKKNCMKLINIFAQ